MRNLVGALLVMLVLSAAMFATLSKLMRNLGGALLVLPAAMLATRVGRQAARSVSGEIRYCHSPTVSAGRNFILRCTIWRQVVKLNSLMEAFLLD